MLSKLKPKNSQKNSQTYQFYEFQVKNKEEKTTAKESYLNIKELKKNYPVIVKEYAKEPYKPANISYSLISPVETILVKDPKIIARIQTLHKNPHRYIRPVWQIRQLPESDTHIVIMPIHPAEQLQKSTKFALDFLKALRHLYILDLLPFEPTSKSIYFVRELNCIQIDIVSNGESLDYQAWVHQTLESLLAPPIFKQLSGTIIKMIRQLSEEKKEYNNIDELARQTATLYQIPPTVQNPYLLTKNINDLVRPNIEYLMKKQVSQFHIVFKASPRNFCCRSFHEATDKLNNLLVILESKSGQVFGGFSTESWAVPQNSVFGCNKLSNTFLFANNVILRPKNKYEAIGCSMNNGPCFGLADIIVGNLNISNVCQFPLTYKPDTNGVVSTPVQLAGGKTFSLEYYEVYSVKFII